MRVRHPNLQVFIVAALLAFGVLVSATIDQGEAPTAQRSQAFSALDPPEFSIEHRPGRLLVSGVSGSASHEDGLLRIIKDQFGDVQLSIDLRAGVILPGDWETNSMRLLYALAATESAQAVMAESEIDVRGVTADAQTLESRLAFLRDEVSDRVLLDEDFIVVENTAPLDELCHRNLLHAVTEPVAFRQSSAEIRTSSYATLDRIIGIANDCRDSRIAVAGHSDASGNEAWNRRLSVARAQAVADYIVRGGVNPRRLIVEGLGSSAPIADNATPRGRSLNRRIEFELR